MMVEPADRLAEIEALRDMDLDDAEVAAEVGFSSVALLQAFERTMRFPPTPLAVTEALIEHGVGKTTSTEVAKRAARVNRKPRAVAPAPVEARPALPPAEVITDYRAGMTDEGAAVLETLESFTLTTDEETDHLIEQNVHGAGRPAAVQIGQRTVTRGGLTKMLAVEFARLRLNLEWFQVPTDKKKQLVGMAALSVDALAAVVGRTA